MSERLVVEKFGGGGSQSAEHILQNVVHMQAEPDLAAAVFSGPGGTSGRATERLIELTAAHASQRDYLPVFDELEAQLSGVAPEGTSDIVNTTMCDIRHALKRGYGYDWVKARPEFFIRDVYAYLLKEAGVEVEEINPVGTIYADAHGRLDVDRTVEHLRTELAPNRLNLIPGFAATTPGWTITNMSRGSTDPVAAVTARALKSLYPNAQVDFILRKDDVSGILRVSPKVRANAEIADELSIPEVETLALGGAEVVHPAVMNLIDGTGVRLLVRNTFDLEHPGTAIVPQGERRLDPDHPVAGITSKSVTAYKWQEATTDALPGSVAAVSGVFTTLGVPITEVQSSSGGVIRVYVDDKHAREYGPAIERGLEKLIGSSTRVSTENDLELVVLVGEALRDSQVMLKVAGRLEEAAQITQTDVRGFWSTGGEPNLYVSVPRGRARDFMDRLYSTFF